MTTDLELSLAKRQFFEESMLVMEGLCVYFHDCPTRIKRGLGFEQGVCYGHGEGCEQKINQDKGEIN